MRENVTASLFGTSRVAEALQDFLAALQGKHGLRALVALYEATAKTVFRLFGETEDEVREALKRLDAPQAAYDAAEWVPAAAESLLFCEKDLKLWVKSGAHLEATLSKHQHLLQEYLGHEDLPGCRDVRNLLEALLTLLRVAEEHHQLSEAEVTRANFARYLLTGDEAGALPLMKPEENPPVKKKTRVSREARGACQHFTKLLTRPMLVTLVNALGVELLLYRSLLSGPDPEKAMQMLRRAGPAGALYVDAMRGETGMADLHTALHEYLEDHPPEPQEPAEIPAACRTPEGWIKPILKAINAMTPLLRYHMTVLLRLCYFNAGVIRSLSKKKARKVFDSVNAPLRPMIPFALEALELLCEACHSSDAEY